METLIGFPLEIAPEAKAIEPTVFEVGSYPSIEVVSINLRTIYKTDGTVEYWWWDKEQGCWECLSKEKLDFSPVV